MSTSCSGPRPITACPRWWRAPRAPGAPCSTPSSRKRRNSTPCPKRRQRPGVASVLTVQEGCDKFCTFCVVPYTRGAEFSRPAAAVIGRGAGAGRARRARDHAARPERQCLSWRHARWRRLGPGPAHPLPSPRSRASRAFAIPRRTRSMSTTRLIAAHRDVPQLMPFLHLPVQSGSDRVLAAMNRRHGVGDYRRTVERLRRARPDLALSSDFIVGFPGESDADFEQTLALVRTVGFAQAFSFKYSQRPGTPAAAARRPGAGRGQGGAACRSASASHRAAAPLQRRHGGTHDPRACSSIAAGIAASSSAAAPGSSRSTPTAPDDLIGTIVPVMVRRAEPNSLAGTLAAGGEGRA